MKSEFLPSLEAPPATTVPAVVRPYAMRLRTLLLFVSLATPALAAAPGSALQSCLTPFLHTDKQGKKRFTFEPRIHTPGPMPSAVEDVLPGTLMCSPGGRIIDAGVIEDDNAHGANDIIIMDGQIGAFVFSDLATGFNLSPDKRFIVVWPWGGPEGQASILGTQTLYLIDVDQSFKPKSKTVLSAVDVYPTVTDALHVSADVENTGAEFDKWYAWFETLPHPDGDITWTGPRRFTFSLADDSQDDAHRPWSGKAFQVTATIALTGGEAPTVALSIAKSPSCPSGVAAIHSIVDAVTACLK